MENKLLAKLKTTIDEGQGIENIRKILKKLSELATK